MTSFLKNRKSCSLSLSRDVRNAYGWFTFQKEIWFILLIECASVCTICEVFFFCFIRNYLSAYLDLFLSTKCYNRQRLMWNSNTSHKMISNMLIRNMQRQDYIKNVKSTCNWHDFEFQTHVFFSNCAKRKYVYHSS